MTAEQCFREQVRGKKFDRHDVEHLLEMLLNYLAEYNRGDPAEECDDLIGEIHAQIFRMGVMGIDEVAKAAAGRRVG